MVTQAEPRANLKGKKQGGSSRRTPAARPSGPIALHCCFQGLRSGLDRLPGDVPLAPSLARPKKQGEDQAVRAVCVFKVSPPPYEFGGGQGLAGRRFGSN